VPIDRLILGDNQFFGINHMSEEKAQLQFERFSDTRSILRIIDAAYDRGIRGLMLTTHERTRAICDHIRAHPEHYHDLGVYPALPYAHKYADAVAEKGIVGALRDELDSANGIGRMAAGILRCGLGLAKTDMIPVMRLLVDAEMAIFRGLNVKVVFLQNIVTDLLVGLKVPAVFRSFSEHINRTYHAEPGFITMNLPALVDRLGEAGLKNPVVCASINKIGYLMNPDRESYERAICSGTFRPVAMSVLASGAIPPKDAFAYVLGFERVVSIVVGASSNSHVKEIADLVIGTKYLYENNRSTVRAG